MKMAERNMEHRHTEERAARRNFFIDRLCGFFLGATLLLVLIGASLWCINNGHQAWAAVFMGTAILGVVGRFIPNWLDRHPNGSR